MIENTITSNTDTHDLDAQTSESCTDKEPDVITQQNLEHQEMIYTNNKLAVKLSRTISKMHQGSAELSSILVDDIVSVAKCNNIIVCEKSLRCIKHLVSEMVSTTAFHWHIYFLAAVLLNRLLCKSIVIADELLIKHNTPTCWPKTCPFIIKELINSAKPRPIPIHVTYGICLMLTAKFSCDDSYINRQWYKMFETALWYHTNDISLPVFNKLERYVFEVLDYDIGFFGLV
tara:strand:- start:339 stop:1031 length:693 start_codon:yes stop_codon:yes gene_type:complete